MPLTFLSHQAPLLPFARRLPRRVDGVALVIGSMAPDFAYVLNRSRFRIWAHAWPGVVVFCVPVTLIVSWIVVRLLAIVVPPHLPRGGPLRLPDYRGLATHRFGLVRSPLSALAGALSHVALDSFTHDWGWAAREVGWYRRVVAEDWFGHEWTPFRIAQYLGHVVGVIVALGLLARYGRDRWMARRAEKVPAIRPDVVSTATLWSGTFGGLALGLAWVTLDHGGSATDILRLAMTTFVGMTAASLAISGRWRRAGR